MNLLSSPPGAPASSPPRTGSGPALATLLARTCRAEWGRLWTVRSTWWFALATAAAVLGIGTLLGIDVHGDPRSEQPDGTAWLAGQITSTFGLYVLLALCVVAATSDHATGGIVASLQATPRRGVLLTARTVVVVTFATVLGCLLVAGSAAVVYAFAPEMGLPAGAGADVLGRVAFVYAAGLLLAVGTGLLARSTAGSLVAVLALMLVLPLMLALLPFDWSQQVTEVLPGSSAIQLLTGDGLVPMTDRAASTTLGAWAALALGAGAARLLHTDADR